MSRGRLAAGSVWALHGFAHLAGFALAWRLIDTETEPYTTEILWSRVDVGDTGMRILGVLWLATAALVAVAAIALVRKARRASAFVGVTAALSAVLCLLQLPSALIGLWIDVVALAAISMAFVFPRVSIKSRRFAS